MLFFVKNEHILVYTVNNWIMMCDIGIDVLCGKYKDKLSKGTRLSKLKLFYHVVDTNGVFNDMDVSWKAKISRHLERGCYSHCLTECKKSNTRTKWDNINFTCQYDITCLELHKAIDSTVDNTAYVSSICAGILSGEINPAELGNKSPMQLNPIRANEYNVLLDMSRGTPVSSFQGSSHYKCKCGSHNTKTESIHNRSMDEGTSKKVTCLICGNSWSE